MHYSNYYPTSGMLHGSLPQLMGTRMDVLLFGDDRQPLENAWDRMERELKALEKMLNRFDPESETSKVNNQASFSAVRLSEELWNILLDCRRYNEMTDGYFDITWSDFDQLVFVEESCSISFKKPGMMLDFGGYGKGYALRCMRKRLNDAGIKRALINLGNSSVLALGGHPFGDSWPIGMDALFNENNFPPIPLSDASLSVSGNSPARMEHIVNPKTNERISGKQMVAIVAEDPVDAEVLTTAWIASGSSNPPDWMLKFNLIKKDRLV